MEGNNIENIEKKNNNVALYIVAIVIIILIGVGVGYLFYKNNNQKLTDNNYSNISGTENERKNSSITNNKDGTELIDNSIELLKDNDFLIRGIYPGLSKNEIVSMLGNAFAESEKDGLLYEINYYNLGIRVYLNSNTDVSERIVLYNNITGTSRGIKVSSSINDVINSFNDENMQKYYIKDGKFYDGVYSGSDNDVIQYVEVGFKGFIRYEWTETNKILFEFKNNSVSNITVGHGAE